MKRSRDVLSSRPGTDLGVETSFQGLIDEHLLAAFDRQLGFADIVGERDWLLDQDAGTLTLGDDLLPAQLLGTVSEESGTWLWAWANESISEALAERAREAARLGRARGVAVLSDPEVEISRIVDGHVLALVVAGMQEADAYHRCPYDGGAAFVLVELPGGPADSAEPPSERAASVVTAALAGLPVAITRKAIVSYLRGLGLPLIESADEVRVDDGSETRFGFDELGRSTEIKGRRRSQVR